MRRQLMLTGVVLAMAGGCDFAPDFGVDDDSDWADSEPPEPIDDPDFSDDGFDTEPGEPPSRLFPTVRAERRPPAISGGTLAVSPDGAFAVAADPDRDQAYIIELDGVRVTTVAFAEGAEPGRVAFDAGGRAHVVLRGEGAVASLDLAGKRALRTSPVCELPRGIVHHAGQDALLVACASGELVTLDPASLAERSRLFVERDLRDVVIDGAGDVVLSRFRTAELLRLHAGEVTQRVRPPVVTRPRFDTFAVDSEGNPVELSAEVSKSPMQAWRMVTSPEGEPVVVHERGDDTEVVPAAGGYGGDCVAIVEGAVSRFDAQGEASPGGALAGVAAGVDAAYSPDGAWLAVAAPSAYLTGNGGTVKIYRSSVADSDEASMDCGTTADGEATLEAQATAVAFDAKGRLLVQSREPAQLEIWELQYGEQTWLDPAVRWIVPLADSSVRDTGHELFHADVGAGLACMSCHGEAGDDGHTWLFHGFGPRRTQSLGGGILATAPFHWEGDMRNFRHLVDDVMVGRMGGFFVDDEQVAALGDWIDRQPATHLAPADAVAAGRGKKLFESTTTGCTSCHAGTTLTNNASVDVGTGGLFQVPSLRGLGLRAPYMHDGCAATLADRFDPACGGKSHGNIAGLSARDIADLVAYLETL